MPTFNLPGFPMRAASRGSRKVSIFRLGLGLHELEVLGSRLINTWVISSTYATGSTATVEFRSNKERPLSFRVKLSRRVASSALFYDDIDYHGIMEIQPNEMHRKYWEERNRNIDHHKCLFYPAFITESSRFSITNFEGNFVGRAALDPSGACLLPVISFL